MTFHQTTGLVRATAIVALGVSAFVTSAIAQPAGIQAANRYQAVQHDAPTINVGTLTAAAQQAVGANAETASKADTMAAERRAPIGNMAAERRAPTGNMAAERRAPIGNMAAERRAPTGNMAAERRALCC